MIEYNSLMAEVCIQRRNRLKQEYQEIIRKQDRDLQKMANVQKVDGG